MSKEENKIFEEEEEGEISEGSNEEDNSQDPKKQKTNDSQNNKGELFFIDKKPNPENKEELLNFPKVENSKVETFENPPNETGGPLYNNPKFQQFKDKYISFSKEPSAPRLFVGQIPKKRNEYDLFPFFGEFGRLYDFKIQRDKKTGEHKGCAFVIYEKKESADMLIKAYNGKKPFSDSKNPLRINLAHSNEKRGKII